MLGSEIGEFLKKCREKSKMSQDQLAKQFPCDRSIISKAENGHHTYPMPFVKRWCELTDSEDDLIAFLHGEEKWRKYEAYENYYIQSKASIQFVEMMA
jgi:transcriptional regulator with XRE-family HTH domain